MSTATDGHRPSDIPQPDDEARISDAVRDIAEQRAFIEQAKGMLMFIYGLDEHAAFDLLRWQSQQHNVKLRALAEQVVKDIAELGKRNPLPNRLEHDRVLLTAHQRVVSSAERQGEERSENDA
ncbi:ANTAR domain-containing protein [Mycobacterium sp. NPDC006124]|uniref:ANTAR domain-containing protein n=1 Tax=Mycobacterium sp. NPDC006124 TaxID=3156729 RepID=UPI0033B60562